MGIEKILKTAVLSGGLLASSLADTPIKSDEFMYGSTIDARASDGELVSDVGKVSIEQTSPKQLYFYYGAHSHEGLSIDEKSDLKIIYSDVNISPVDSVEVKLISGENLNRRSNVEWVPAMFSVRRGVSSDVAKLNSSVTDEGVRDYIEKQGVGIIEFDRSQFSGFAGLEAKVDFKKNFIHSAPIIGLYSKFFFNSKNSSWECSDKLCSLQPDINSILEPVENHFWRLGELSYVGRDELPKFLGNTFSYSEDSRSSSMRNILTFQNEGGVFYSSKDFQEFFTNKNGRNIRLIALANEMDAVPYEVLLKDFDSGDRFRYFFGKFPSMKNETRVPKFKFLELPNEFFENQGDSIFFKKVIPEVLVESPISFSPDTRDAVPSNGKFSLTNGVSDFCFLYDGYFVDDVRDWKKQGFKLSKGKAYFVVDQDFVDKYGEDIFFSCNLYYNDSYRGTKPVERFFSKTQIDGVYAVGGNVKGGFILRKTVRSSSAFFAKNSENSFWGYIANDFFPPKSPFYKRR